MQKLLKLTIKPLWNGGQEIEGTLENGERVKLASKDEALAFLVEKINAQGFELSRGPRQEFQRLTINK